MINTEDDFENIEDPIYQNSGLICESCGYDDSLKCYIDVPINQDEENTPAQILCGKHAAENGYCCCCGLYSAGITSFDFHHPGYCDNCYDQVVSDCGEYNREDEDEHFYEI